jgi:8-oxo-dGTP pyrophosphatase MutT (NUDIX family)
VTAPAWLQPLLAEVHEIDAERMMPWIAEPAPEGMRQAAVLILFGEGAHGPDVLLIERSPHLRSHAGQPAFPGGGVDPTDDGPAAAALREAQEETGLDPDGVEVLAVLPDMWLSPSGNVVTPVVAWWREPSEVTPADEHEVAAVARVPISELTDPANRLQIRHPTGYTGPAFRVADMLVWGFTAGVLDRLLALGGWELPWRKDRIEELPADVLRLALRQRRRHPDQPYVAEG